MSLGHVRQWDVDCIVLDTVSERSLSIIFGVCVRQDIPRSGNEGDFGTDFSHVVSVLDTSTGPTAVDNPPSFFGRILRRWLVIDFFSDVLGEVGSVVRPHSERDEVVEKELANVVEWLNAFAAPFPVVVDVSFVVTDADDRECREQRHVVG